MIEMSFRYYHSIMKIGCSNLIFHLFSNELVSLAKHIPPLRMAKHCPLRAAVLKTMVKTKYNVIHSPARWSKPHAYDFKIERTKTICGLCSPVNAPLAAL